MLRRIEKLEYQVDEAMMGSDWNLDDSDDLEEFCKVLQRECDKRCLFVEIVPILDSHNGASNPEIYMDREGNQIEIDWLLDVIPWMEALEIYDINKYANQGDAPY